MNDGTFAAVLVLLGTIVGAAAGILGNLVMARAATRNEFRRIAIDAAMREWEINAKYAQQHGGEMYPPPLYMFYNAELLRLIEDGTLNPLTYAALTEEIDRFRKAIQDHTERRRAERRSQ